MTYEERLALLNPVEREYRIRMSELSPAERLQRGLELSQLMYNYTKRRVLEENPGIEGKALTKALALALYPNDPGVVELLKLLDTRE